MLPKRTLHFVFERLQELGILDVRQSCVHVRLQKRLTMCGGLVRVRSRSQIQDEDLRAFTQRQQRILHRSPNIGSPIDLAWSIDRPVFHLVLRLTTRCSLVRIGRRSQIYDEDLCAFRQSQQRILHQFPNIDVGWLTD